MLRLTGSRAQSRTSVIRSGVVSSSAAISAGSGSRPVLAVELALDPPDPAELLHQVDGQPDGAGLVGYGTGDGLPDPPGRVGGELEALGVVELLDRADQAGVALLDEVEQRQSAARVAAGHRDDQPQVGSDEDVLGALAPASTTASQLVVRSRRPCSRPRPSSCSAKTPASMDLGQLDLPGGVEQRGPRDLVEVHADQVAVGHLPAGGANAAGSRRCDGGRRHGLPCVLPLRVSVSVTSVLVPRGWGTNPWGPLRSSCPLSEKQRLEFGQNSHVAR